MPDLIGHLRIMPDVPYSQRHLFRMLHINNLESVLKDGMYAPNVKHDSSYVNIGDEVLIAQRGEFEIPIAPGGVLSDYVPFYFGGCSPMLLNIKTGYRGVKQRSQSEIVYLCTHIETIIRVCPGWCFTDGHAKNRLTNYYNQVVDLEQIDWSVVEDKYWKNTEDDLDKMRRKQAEFLVKGHVPTSCFSGVIVHDDTAASQVKIIEAKAGINLPVFVDKNHKYYYDD